MIKYNKLKYNINITPEITKITNLVYKNNGKTYGGYVRDYLININRDNLQFINYCKDIKRIIYKYINFDCQDIDIWFKSKYKMKKFLKDLDNLYNLQICKLGGVDKHYPCEIYRYMLYRKNVDKVYIHYLSGFSYLIEYCKYEQLNLGYVIFIDIAISDIFPVNDFSINLLSFNGNNLKVEHKKYSLSEILNHIRNKQLILLPDFIDVTNPPYNKSYHKTFNNQLKINRYNKFINRGYTQVQSY